MSDRLPDGNCPFEDHDCGHLTGPAWLEGNDADDRQPVAAGPQPVDEPELDSPHHVHDLWTMLGLGDQ